MLTIKGAGFANITANQAASGDYTLGSKSTTFTVFQGTPSLGIFSIDPKVEGDLPFELTPPTSNSTGSFSYAVTGVAGVATIDGNMVNIVAAGSTTITATQAASANYMSASIAATFTVSSSGPSEQKG